MAWYRCTVCHPTAIPRKGVLYFPAWSSQCPLCLGTLTVVPIKGVVTKAQAALVAQRAETQQLSTSRLDARLATREEGDPEPAADDAADGDEGKATAVLASKAKVERARRRRATGEPGLDTVLGGGWLEGFTYALHGPHGSGKSRLQRLASVLMCQYGPVVYAVSPKEEHADDVLRAFESGSHEGVPYYELPGVKKRLHVVKDADNSDRIARIAVELGAVYVVCDSISTVYTSNAPRQPYRQMSYAMELFRAVGRKKGITFSCNAHEDSEGQLKGGTDGAYMADAVVTVKMMQRRRNGTIVKLGSGEDREEKFKGLIRLGNEKNRGVKGGLLALFQLHDTGILAVPNPPSDDDDPEDDEELPDHGPTKGPTDRKPDRAPVQDKRPARKPAHARRK